MDRTLTATKENYHRYCPVYATDNYGAGHFLTTKHVGFKAQKMQ